MLCRITQVLLIGLGRSHQRRNLLLSRHVGVIVLDLILVVLILLQHLVAMISCVLVLLLLLLAVGVHEHLRRRRISAVQGVTVASVRIRGVIVPGHG